MGDSAVLAVNARVRDLGRAGPKLVAISAVSQAGYWYTCGAKPTTTSLSPCVIIIIIIIASHEDEMNDKYNDKLCTSNEVIQ